MAVPPRRWCAPGLGPRGPASARTPVAWSAAVRGGRRSIALASAVVGGLLSLGTQLDAQSSQPARQVTAFCRDGSLLYAATRRGACSRHGGVARWGGQEGTRDAPAGGARPDVTPPSASAMGFRAAPPQGPRPAAPAMGPSGPQRGPRGGFFVITASGKKRYIPRDRCG